MLLPPVKRFAACGPGDADMSMLCRALVGRKDSLLPRHSVDLGIDTAASDSAASGTRHSENRPEEASQLASVRVAGQRALQRTIWPYWQP